MDTLGSRVALFDALAELDRLGGEADRERVAGLADRLRSERLRVLVAGEAKRGKSTVVNTLLGRRVLPTGITPVTAVATVVRYGTDEHVRAEFSDGHSERRPLGDLPGLVTERGNPANRLGLTQATVYIDADMTARGVEIVDTPGTGSVFEHNTAVAEQALDHMDAAVFVLTADPPISAAERDLLARVAQASVRVFVLLNKADRLDAAERDEAVEFTVEHVRRAAGHNVQVRPVSARAGAADPGFATFINDFADYLATGRVADLAESVTRQARRVADRLMDEVQLARRARQMREGAAAERIQLFRDRLQEVTVHRRDAVDLAEAEGRRLLAALNLAADADGSHLTAQLRAQVAAFLNARRDRSVDAIEQTGRRRLVELATGAAETWRTQQRERLEAGLSELDARLTSALNDELADVRTAARELLGLGLVVPEAEGRLVENRRFFYIVAEGVGQTELLAGTIRRHLPGEFGRRRAREYVLGEVAELVPKLVGRARSDLQYRLAEATRALVRAIEARYAESADRLLAVLDAATDHDTRAPDTGRGSDADDLDEREAALTGVLARLDAARRAASCAS
jgi:GTPase Era involved in 16S rRNA processing